jgi:hypothetical protein
MPLVPLISELGHQRQIGNVCAMSANPPTPDISLRRGERRKGPIGDIMALIRLPE